MRTALSLLLLAIPLGFAVVSCSSDDDAHTGPVGGSDGGNGDGASTHDAASSGDSGGGSDAGGGGDGASGDDASSGKLTLTINNYLAWCAVTVDGGTPSTSDPIPVQVAPNTVVHLHGDTRSSTDFVWGYWLGVDGDGGHDTNMNATVTVTKNVTVQACCPTTGAPTTPCPPP